MPGQSRSKANKYAATQWGVELTIDLTCPSGQLCLVRRPGVTGLIRAGILDSLDALTGIVQTDHIERVKSGKDPSITSEDIQALAQDKEALMAALDLADKVVEYVVLQPSALRPVVRNEQGRPVVERLQMPPDKDHKTEWTREVETPLPDADRVPGQVYTDMIDLIDRMFIFQFVVGGVSDLERFREEFGQTLGSLEAV